MGYDPLAYLTDQGWTAPQAAGIIGNAYGESGLNPAAIGDNGSAYGLFQYHADRQARFKQAMGFDIHG